MAIAGNFLGTRPRTRREVELRLRRAGSSDEVAAAALVRLEELGLIDDLAFANWWIVQRDRHAPRGRRMIEAELRQHGIPREVIVAVRDREPDAAPADEEVLPRDEAERAATALLRHLRGAPFPEDRRAQQRAGAFLLRRGFDSETVRTALRSVRGQLDDPDGDGH